MTGDRWKETMARAVMALKKLTRSLHLVQEDHGQCGDPPPLHPPLLLLFLLLQYFLLGHLILRLLLLHLLPLFKLLLLPAGMPAPLLLLRLLSLHLEVVEWWGVAPSSCAWPPPCRPPCAGGRWRCPSYRTQEWHEEQEFIRLPGDGVQVEPLPHGPPGGHRHLWVVGDGGAGWPT